MRQSAVAVINNIIQGRMKTKLIPFAALFSALFIFASCLKNDDDGTITYGDTAITAFTLGNLKYPKPGKTKTGKDTIYQIKLTGSKYKFYIDQINKQIYNVDSLPYGVNAKKILCTLSAKNGGAILYKSLTSDSLKFLSTKDSIDFSQPREFRVYSRDGRSYRSYTVKVNVHKIEVGKFAWHHTNGQDDRLGVLSAMKAVALNGKIYVMGTEGTTTKLYATDNNDVGAWQQLTPNITLDSKAYSHLIAFDGYLYTYSNNRIQRSKNGVTWETKGIVALKQLAGGANGNLYGVTDSGILTSKDGGTTWQSETLASSSTNLPSQNISLFSFPSKVNTNAHDLVLIGNPPTGSNLLGALAWGKQIDASLPAQSWFFYGLDNLPYTTPALTNLQLVKMGEDLLAFGGKGIGEYKAKAFESFFISEGKGTGWKKDARLPLPANFESSETSFAMTIDENNNLWLIAGGSGRIWKGNLAGLLLKK